MKSGFYDANPKRNKSIKPLNPIFKYNVTITLPNMTIIIAIHVPMHFLWFSYDFPMIFAINFVDLGSGWWQSWCPQCVIWHSCCAHCGTLGTIERSRDTGAQAGGPWGPALDFWRFVSASGSPFRILSGTLGKNMCCCSCMSQCQCFNDFQLCYVIDWSPYRWQ